MVMGAVERDLDPAVAGRGLRSICGSSNREGRAARARPCMLHRDFA